MTNYFYANAAKYGMDKDNFNLIGESCGGNLVTTVAMKIRDHGGAEIKSQIIISPMLGLNFATNSYKECETGYILTNGTMEWFWNKYLVSVLDQNNPYAVPLIAKNLANLPKALLVTTEYDVLRDDGKQYSELLKAAGNDVTYKCYAGLIHGFLDLYYKSPEATAACDEIMHIVRSWIN